MRFFSLTLLLTLSTGLGAVPFPGSYRLNYELHQKLWPETKRLYKRQLAEALHLVADILPYPGTKRFPWETGERVTVQFYGTWAGDPWIAHKNLPDEKVSGLSFGKRRGEHDIVLYYLFDRLYLNSDGSARNGTFIELAVAIVSQFDAISQFLQRGPKAFRTDAPPKERKQRMIQVQHAIIHFLREVARRPEILAFDKASRARIPEYLAQAGTHLLVLGCSGGQDPSRN